MPRRSILVVGGGQAGVQTAISLRDLGFDGKVVIVGAERYPPYQRPPLSKAFLAERSEPATLEIRSPQYYAEHEIEVITGERVERLDHRGLGGLAHTDAGRLIPYDGLALTTGVRARPLTVSGAQAHGVRFLRDADEAVALREDLWGVRSLGGDVVIVGAGFVGLEVAATCRKYGIGVTVIEAAERVIARAVGPHMSQALADAHAEQGTRLLLRTTVEEIEADTRGDVSGVRTSSGERIPCRTLVVGIGSTPRTELATQLGIAVEGGIVVDDRCRTTLPNVVAAGDCAVFRPQWAAGPVRLESVPNAAAQGHIAAAALLGEDVAPQPPPWFWSDQGDLKLQIAGWTVAADDYVVRETDRPHAFSVVCFRDGRLAGIESLNSPHDFNAIKRGLAKGATLSPAQAADTTTPLKNALS